MREVADISGGTKKNGGIGGFREARECDSNDASKLILDGIVDRFPALDVGDGVYLSP